MNMTPTVEENCVALIECLRAYIDDPLHRLAVPPSIDAGEV